MKNETLSAVVIFLIQLGICGGDVRAQQCPTPPFVLDCGPKTDEDRFTLAEAHEQRAISGQRLLRLPDVPLASERFGHRGGEGYRHWHGGCRPSMGGDWEIDLFSSGRVDPRSYSFTLSPGEYQIGIGICEGHVHAAGQRIFDVVVNNKVIASDVDPISLAGYKEPMLLTARVRHTGDSLSVSFRAKTDRRPIVSAIWIHPIHADDQSEFIVSPSNVRCVGSYRANLLSWRRPMDLRIRGFLVRRRTPREEDFEIITPNLVHAHRWADRDVIAGRTYDYQVGSCDEFGKVSWSRTVTGRPRSPEDSTLPVYAIELPAQARRRLLMEVHEEQTERGTFRLHDQSYPIEIRIRGASTRHAAKKSYRIRFTGECPFRRKVTYLKAEPMDHTMQQEKLSCDLFRAAGVHCSEAAYVNLFLNGQYEGVYLDIEPIRSPFKNHDGLDPQGTLIRANTFQHGYGFDEVGQLRGDAGSLNQLERFIEQINQTPRGEFAPFIRKHTDWPQVRDYLALIVLTHRTEIEANDYFFYRAPESGRWSLIPWDHNNGNFHVQAYRNRIGEPYIHIFPQTAQQLGWQPDYWYVLPSRIFHSPSLRHDYLNRLEELTRTWLVSPGLDAMVDSNYEQLRNEYPLDPHRWPFRAFDPFTNSADQLQSFIRLHAKQILQRIEQERNRRPSNLVVNEFKFGEQQGWVEIHNRGDKTESLRRVQLVTKNEAGNWRLPLRAERSLRPNEYRILNIPHRPIKLPTFTDAEARDRWEINRPRTQDDAPFPGYAPGGGFIGLVRQDSQRGEEGEARNEDDDDGPRESMLDFFFYGPPSPKHSYGRLATGFGFQTPSPGSGNAAK